MYLELVGNFISSMELKFQKEALYLAFSAYFGDIGKVDWSAYNTYQCVIAAII